MKKIILLFLITFPVALVAQTITPAEDINNYIEVSVFPSNLAGHKYKLRFYGSSGESRKVLNDAGKEFRFETLAHVFNFFSKEGYDFVTHLPQNKVDKSGNIIMKVLFKKRE